LIWKIGSTGLKEKERVLLSRWLDSESLLHDLTYFCASVHGGEWYMIWTRWDWLLAADTVALFLYCYLSVGWLNIEMQSMVPSVHSMEQMNAHEVCSFCDQRDRGFILWFFGI
jgi:hypothetical protein